MFFHITFKRPFYSEHDNKVSPITSEKLSENLSEKTSEKILREIKNNKNITIKELAKIVNISNRIVEYHIANLKAQGKLVRIGSDKAGHWKTN